MIVRHRRACQESIAPVPLEPPSVVPLRGEQRRPAGGRPGGPPGVRVGPARAPLPPALALGPVRQRRALDGSDPPRLARVPAHGLAVHGRPGRLRPLRAAHGPGSVHRHRGRSDAPRARARVHPVARSGDRARAGRGVRVRARRLLAAGRSRDALRRALALDFPARRTALYTLVGSRRVATAIPVETVWMQVAKMVGPVLAGVGLARLGPAPCYVGVAALYAVGLLVFVGLPGRIGGPSGRDVTSVVASLGAGFREAWREPTVRAVLLITVMMNVLFFPYQHMLPVFARHVLSVGPEWLGGLVAADGLGALLGALAIAGRRGFLPHGRIFGAAVLTAPFLLLGFPSPRWPWACLPVLVLIGACESAFAAMQSTLVLLQAPEASRGRAMGILSACIGTQPAGTLWIGFLAGGIGVPAAMAINGMAALVAMLPAAWPLARRGRI